jgi:hypothetical protein
MGAPVELQLMAATQAVFPLAALAALLVFQDWMPRRAVPPVPRLAPPSGPTK